MKREAETATRVPRRVKTSIRRTQRRGIVAMRGFFIFGKAFPEENRVRAWIP